MATTASAEKRNYVATCRAYAKRSANDANSHIFGKWMRLVARRFLADLERAKLPNAPFYFDAWHANDVCDFVEKLPHVEGSWETETITLHESDIFFLCNLFGWRKQDGSRRFTSAAKIIARKNAKSTIAAAIGLYCETCENENGPQVLSAATTGKQARIVFGIAKRMVEKTPALRHHFVLEPLANSIVCYNNGGSFQPINAKASTQDGLNPSCLILDEIHAHKTHDLMNVLKSAAGARKNPLFLFTTTEGYETPGPWPELRHFCKQLLLGLIDADHFFCTYYAVDDADQEAGTPADDDFDESCWVKANPLMECNPILLAEIRKEAVEAKQMPGRHAEFRIKRLNRPTSVAGGWINLHKWRACKGEVDLEFLKNHPCTGGLDMASTRDLTSFRLVWRIRGDIYTYGWRFVPRTAVGERKQRGLIPYEAWVQSGALIEAGETDIDYAQVEKTIIAASQRFKIESIAYDPWNARELTGRLRNSGLNMVEFAQGAKSYHPAMQALERAYISGRLHHGSDPVLNWCAGNLVARMDQNLNLAPDRRRASEKIDDVCALLMAIGTDDIEPASSLADFLSAPIC